MARGRFGLVPDWLASAVIWLAALPGALGWSWWHVVWIAVLIAAFFASTHSYGLRVGQTRHAAALGVALLIVGPLAIAACLFGIGRLVAADPWF